MIFACYQVPLKHLSTLESLQGNGSKVPECNQEPGPHLLKADHAHQSFNAGSHFRMSQDAKQRSVGIISTECWLLAVRETHKIGQIGEVKCQLSRDGEID